MCGCGDNLHGTSVHCTVYAEWTQTVCDIDVTSMCLGPVSADHLMSTE